MPKFKSIAAGLLFIVAAPLSAAAEVEQRTLSLLMEAQPVNSGPRPYLGTFGPIFDATFRGIEMPADPTANWTVSFIKPGHNSVECGDPEAVVNLRDGGSLSAEQLNELGLNGAAIDRQIAFGACISLSVVRRVDRFFINVIYDKEIEDEPPGPMPAVITKRLLEDREEGNSRMRRWEVTCQQLGSNEGCRTDFDCVMSGFVLAEAGARCDLENGRLSRVEGSVSNGRIRVVKESDVRDLGRCQVGSNIQRSGVGPIDPLAPGFGTEGFNFPIACREHDENGGDCAISASLTCRRTDRAAARIVPFECSRSDSNEGCEKTINCPTGHVVVDARAACNLERPDAVQLPDFGTLRVGRVTDPNSQGLRRSDCRIGNDRIFTQGFGEPQDTENIILRPLLASITVSCREHDENGGDCNISGELLCAPIATAN